MVTTNKCKKDSANVSILSSLFTCLCLSFKYAAERVLPADLLDIASENNLRGVKIHKFWMASVFLWQYGR